MKLFTKLFTTKSLLAASLGLGITAMVPTVASAHERVEVIRYDRDDCDFTRDVSFDQLPYRVRCAVERVGGGNRIDTLQFVRKYDREFFRVVIDRPGCDTLFRIDREGHVISSEEVRHYAPAPPRYSDRDRWEHERDRHDRYDDGRRY